MSNDMNTAKNKASGWLPAHFELSHGGKKSIQSMEGLRGLAVLLVFFAHYVVLMQPWVDAQSWTYSIGGILNNLGHSGVDLFFVMSGYLIYGAVIRRERPIIPFLKGRATRIYPTFLVVFSLYLGLSLALPGESKFPTQSGAALIYTLQNLAFLPGVFDIEPLIVVTWSLSYEIAYYIAMPVLVTALALRRWTPKQRLQFFLGVTALGFTYYCFTHGHIRMLMFVSGVLVYELQKQNIIRPRSGSGLVALGIAVAVMILIKVLWLQGWWRYLSLFVLFGYLCLDCFSGRGLTSRVFSWAPLRWFGNMSYSYYLLHGLCLKATVFLLARVSPGSGSENHMFWLMMLPAFAITVVGSAALFLFVERPMSLFATSPKFGEPRTVLGIPTDGSLATVAWRLFVPAFAATKVTGRMFFNPQGLRLIGPFVRQLVAALIPLGLISVSVLVTVGLLA
jgi:exopolysaccharide production protein ExoZ